MNNILPEKYIRLQQVAEAGLLTPRSLLLSVQEDWAEQIDIFIERASADIRFIVRSAYVGEDGATESFAGHFWSSGAVTADQLTETIALAEVENRAVLAALGQGDLPYLIVQEYVEHQIGGVLFWPWSFFSEYMCVDYSAEGVQRVVEGRSRTAVLALDKQSVSPLPLADEHDFLLPLLRSFCLRLRAGFGFAFDCEWAYSEQYQSIVILQVRPQTHAVGSILSLPVEKKPALPAGNWQFTVLSESLGRLSPLSFSLLQQLYSDMVPVFRELGCSAKSSDFLIRFPDGTVLVDKEAEQVFYAPTLIGGFWRGFREPGVKKRLQLVVSEYDVEAEFSYECLAEAFCCWMVANYITGGAVRMGDSLSHVYEVSWQQPSVAFALTDGLIELQGEADSWEEIGARARNQFLAELGKLKQIIALNRSLAFCEWDEYSVSNFSTADTRQYEQAQTAIYDHAAMVSGVGNEAFRSLAATKVVSGKAVVVHHPASQQGTIPEGCILLAPYFDNRWVASIPLLEGVVVAQGSQLSHSAIVAREYGIPYCVLTSLDLYTVQDGMQVCLDTVQQKVSW